MLQYKHVTANTIGIIYSNIQKDIERLASKMARKYYCEQLQEDLVSTGAVAFMQHLRGFDPEINPRLVTYLYPYMKAAMRREVEKNLGPFSLSKREFRKCCEEKTLSLLTKISLNPAFDEYVRHLKGSLTPAANRSMEQELYIQVCIEHLQDAFDTLSFKEQELLGGFFGAFGHEKRTLADLGEEFCISEEAARKAKDKALEKLQDACVEGELGRWVSIPAAFLKAKQQAISQSISPSHQPQPCYGNEILEGRINQLIINIRAGNLPKESARRDLRDWAIETVVEQLLYKRPAITADILNGLTQSGFDWLTAIEMIAAVSLEEAYYTCKYGSYFSLKRYTRKLRQLFCSF